MFLSSIETYDYVLKRGILSNLEGCTTSFSQQ